MAGLKYLLCAFFFFPIVQHGACDKMTLDKLGTKMDSLINKLNTFTDTVSKIDTVATNAINDRNDIGANKIWAKIMSSHNNTYLKEKILNNIIISSYSGNRGNILPLIRFISQTKQCSGYETLYDEMDDYSHFYDGGEIFSLASSFLQNCADNKTLFLRMPEPVQLIFTTPVTLQNTFNKGFLFRKQNLQDNVMENHIATINKNGTDPDTWLFLPSGEFAETFNIQTGNDLLVASASRRFYFSHETHSKFLLEMNRHYEISIGLELEDNRGGKRTFYRLYVQKQRLRNGEVFEVNLWTINPKDEYYKFIYWHVRPKNDFVSRGRSFDQLLKTFCLLILSQWRRNYP
ncbi:unnamed protein product [Allacma fusca]|uniref:Uncharacterized protein n=1 Tax=Allacma fusca TaxID=39272 RepID=A0A8J2LTC6_9HEXA|nr:unnamed protein product [Allacma fusca]